MLAKSTARDEGRIYGADLRAVTLVGDVPAELTTEELREWADFLRPTQEWADFEAAGLAVDRCMVRQAGSSEDRTTQIAKAQRDRQEAFSVLRAMAIGWLGAMTARREAAAKKENKNDG